VAGPRVLWAYVSHLFDISKFLAGSMLAVDRGEI
jgi:hypothetical protein